MIDGSLFSMFHPKNCHMMSGPEMSYAALLSYVVTVVSIKDGYKNIQL